MMDIQGFKFFNMAGDTIWECKMGLVELSDYWNPDKPTTSAIRLLMSNMSPPPEDACVLIGTSADGIQRWSVGPFDIMVELVK